MGVVLVTNSNREGWREPNMGQGSMTPGLWAPPPLAESEVGEGMKMRSDKLGGEGVGVTTARMGPASSNGLDLEAAGPGQSL